MIEQRIARLTLRYLAVKYRRDWYPASLDRYQFDSFRLFELFLAHNVDTKHVPTVLQYLSAEGHIRFLGSGGLSGDFVLTESGFSLGSPESVGRGLLAVAQSSAGLALIFTASTLGLIGGPLALAGLAEPVIKWKGVLDLLVTFWKTKVTQPVQQTISIPLNAIGLPPPPTWLIEYLTLGVLVVATMHNMLRAHNNMIAVQPDPAPSTRLGRIVWWPIENGLQVLLWPLHLAGELVACATGLYYYVFRRSEVPGEYELSMPPAALVLRLVVLLMPFAVFFALCLVNLAF